MLIICIIRIKNTLVVKVTSETCPSRSWVLGATLWEAGSVQVGPPELLGAGAHCSAIRMPRSNPTYATCCWRNALGGLASALPWAYISSQSPAPLQAAMGPSHDLGPGVAQKQDEWIFWSLCSTQLSRHIWTPSLPDCSPTQTRRLLQGAFQTSPPCSALWMPFL